MSKSAVLIVATLLGLAWPSFTRSAPSMTPSSAPLDGLVALQRPDAPSGLWRVWAVDKKGKTIRTTVTSSYTTALNTQRAWSAALNPQGGRAYIKKIQ